MRSQGAACAALAGAMLCALVAPTAATPNYQGCLNSVAKALPYCDSTKPIKARVADLISRLTLDEKVTIISPRIGGNTCNMQTSAIDSVGFPTYMWLDETNTAAASACVGPNKCATTFPGPEGMGASFNRSLWFAKGDVLGTEQRALSNHNWYRGQGPTDQIGVTGFGPNINIARDPRFGRNSELPGEDPYLSGQYAASMVQGMQQEDKAGHPKMIALLKHFTAYSRETNRGHDTYNISAYDFADTYLPQYEAAFRQGGASGVMCSYDAENGHPSCANGWLLNTVMRGQWNQPDALTMTDCGVVNNMLGPPAHAPDAEHAVAWTINNGTDLEAGTTLWSSHLADAVNHGLVSEATVDEAVRRAVTATMRAGRFDPVDMVEWSSIGLDQLNSSAHQQLNYEAAAQSFVLLKNDGPSKGGLPIKMGAHVAVLGPQASAQFGLLSDYAGDMQCYNNGSLQDNYDCIPTIAASIDRTNKGGVTTTAMGVEINSNNASGIAEAIALAKAADVVVLALGIDRTIEHEGQDRVNISLPGLQEPFAHQVLALGKPTILVLTNGGALAIDNLIAGPNAIVEAFNPSVMGAPALADTLFGKVNRWGKMPITTYPADIVNQLDMTNYNMTKAPGRTYRYYTGKPLFPFGTGMSLTTFTHTCKPASEPTSGNAASFKFSCTIANTGGMAGDEVLMVYHSAGSDVRAKVDHAVPIRSLVAFERVSLAAGATSAAIEFTLGTEALQLTNAAGQQEVVPGMHQFIFSRGNGKDVAFTVNV